VGKKNPVHAIKFHNLLGSHSKPPMVQWELRWMDAGACCVKTCKNQGELTHNAQKKQQKLP